MMTRSLSVASAFTTQSPPLTVLITRGPKPTCGRTRMSDFGRFLWLYLVHGVAFVSKSGGVNGRVYYRRM